MVIMSYATDSSLLSFFTMIADPVRLQILLILLKVKESPVSALIEKIDRSQPMISYHLGCLRDCGLINAKKSSKDARIMLYSLHEPDVVEKIFLLAENFLLKHDVCKYHPTCQVKSS